MASLHLDGLIAIGGEDTSVLLRGFTASTGSP